MTRISTTVASPNSTIRANDNTTNASGNLPFQNSLNSPLDQYKAANDKNRFFNSLDTATQKRLSNQLDTAEKIELFNKFDRAQMLTYFVNFVEDRDIRVQLFESLSHEKQIPFYSRLVKTGNADSFSLTDLSNASLAAELFSMLPADLIEKYLQTASVDEKSHLCGKMEAELALKFLNTSISRNNTLNLAKKIYLSFSPQVRNEVLQKLPQATRTKLLAHIIDYKSTAMLFVGIDKSPFTTEGAKNFARSVSKNNLDSTHIYSLIVDADSPALKEYKKCTAAGVANQMCLATKLTGANISCVETVTPGILSGSTEQRICTVSLVSPQFTEKENRTRLTIFQMPKDSDALASFLADNFPDLGPNNPYKAASSKDLVAIALNSKAKGITFKEGDGVNNPGLIAHSTYVSNKVHSIFNPDEVNAEKYFSKDNMNEQDNGKELEVQCSRLITGGELKSSHCQFVVKATDNTWTQRVTHFFDAKGGFILGASNPEFTLNNYQAFFTKLGTKARQVITQSGPILRYGEPPVQPKMPKPAPSSDSDNTTGFSSWMKFPSSERLAEVFFMNMAPAALGAAVAGFSTRFIRDTIKDTKKTIGQKVAGVATVGLIGAAGGLLAYERLSHLNLKVPSSI